APKLAGEVVMAAIAAGPHDGGAREADLLRALPAVVKREPGRRAEAIGSLRAALAPERSFEVRGRAVMALGTLGSGGDPGALAAALVGESGDHGAAPELATALRGLVNEAEGDLALEGVAATALRALAHLGGPDAIGAAVTLAGDRRHPYRATAIEALATMCDP